MTLALRFPSAAAVLALLAASPALAAEFRVDSRPDAVTIFPSEAAVTRRGTVTIEAGEHVLRLAGLPANLDPASVRIEAEAPFGVEIGAVDLRRVEPAPPPVAERSDIERQIAALEAERAVAEDARAVGEARLRMSEALVAAGGQGVAEGLRAGAFNPQLMRDVVAAAAGEQEAAHAAIRGAKTRVRDLDIDIARLRARLETPPDQTQPTTAATVAVTSAGAGPVKLKLDYRVAGAGWTPFYEARLTTGGGGAKPSLAFALRASVEQETGEDWRDVELTLSTTQPARDADAATLPVLVGREAPPPRPLPKAMEGGARFTMAAPAPVAPADARFEVARERDAGLVMNGAIVTYRVPGRVSLAAHAEPKTLKVGEERVEPTLTLRAVPKLAPVAYLGASFRRAGADGLLAGRAQLYRDGIYVGTGQVEQTPAGEPIRLGFGEDPRLKIDYAPVRSEEGETGTFTTQRMKSHDARITLRNIGPDPLAVLIEDQLPVAEMTDLKIEPLATNTAPTQLGRDGRRGAVAWALDLKPAESREIRFGWTARWPADKPLVWQSVPK